MPPVTGSTRCHPTSSRPPPYAGRDQSLTLTIYGRIGCRNGPERPVNQSELSAPIEGERLGTFLGRHWQHAGRSGSSKPAALRLIAPLAGLVIAGIAVCTGLAYVLAKQADDFLEAEHRQALAGAVEALQAVSPDLTQVE